MRCRFVFSYGLFGDACCLHSRGTQIRLSSLFLFFDYHTERTAAPPERWGIISNRQRAMHQKTQSCEKSKHVILLPLNGTSPGRLYSIGCHKFFGINSTYFLTCFEGLKHAYYIATV
jgi:hypothetical protein